MAKIDFSDLDKLCMDFKEMADIPASVVDSMLNAQADVIVTGQKQVGERMGVRQSGMLLESISKGKAKTGRDGRYIEVSAKGSRTRGGTTTKNSEIAFINEFGKRGQAARPFISTANEEFAEQAVDAAEKIYDNYLRSKGL